MELSRKTAGRPIRVGRRLVAIQALVHSPLPAVATVRAGHGRTQEPVDLVVEALEAPIPQAAPETRLQPTPLKDRMVVRGRHLGTPSTGLVVAAVRVAREMTLLTVRDQAAVVAEHPQRSAAQPFFTAAVVVVAFTVGTQTPQEHQELVASAAGVPAMATSPRLVRLRHHLVPV